MFFDTIDNIEYERLMSSIKKMNRTQREYRKKCELLSSSKKNKLLRFIEQLRWENAVKVFISKIKSKKEAYCFKKKLAPYVKHSNSIESPNYFSKHRIAVYTCIFGAYDDIYEPYCFPNNIDYYIITDLKIAKKSRWKIVNISLYEKMIDGFSDVEKNRWFKMHPDIVFPQYRYSVYIDGNIVPVTDFTEYINRIKIETGTAMFWHKYNNCVYQEALYNEYVVKKIPIEELHKHVEYLHSQKMPYDFGMTTCNVIARDHDNPMCKQIMSMWWEEFLTHSKRDQMSFPYVIWRLGLKMEDIAVLGNDVWDEDSLMILDHMK